MDSRGQHSRERNLRQRQKLSNGLSGAVELCAQVQAGRDENFKSIKPAEVSLFFIIICAGTSKQCQ